MEKSIHLHVYHKNEWLMTKLRLLTLQTRDPMPNESSEYQRTYTLFVCSYKKYTLEIHIIQLFITNACYMSESDRPLFVPPKVFFV